MTILSAIASVIVAFMLPVWYASSVNFVPPQESEISGGNSSGISAVMKDFGLSKVGGSKSQEYSMIVFLQSRSVVDSVMKKYDIQNAYKMNDDAWSDVRKEFLSNISIEFMEEGNYELTVWDTDKERASNIANDYVKITNYFAEKTHREESKVNADYLTNRIASIDSTIIVISTELGKLSKEKAMFSPEEQARAAGTALASIKETELQYELAYDYYRNSFGETDPNTVNAKGLYEAAKNKVADAYSKPGLVGNFSLGDAAPVAVAYLTKYADIEALTKTKALLTTSLEKAILDNKNNANNFFVIDNAIPADKKGKPKRFFIAAGGTFGGFIFAVFIILLVNSAKIASKQVKQLKEAEQ
jgi:uncharacterized protein involved in exopolysaccharide biosynthesis